MKELPVEKMDYLLNILPIPIILGNQIRKSELFNQDQNSTERPSLQLTDSLEKRRNLSSTCQVFLSSCLCQTELQDIHFAL